MKTTTTKQSWWLAGYYDDFNSARAVADDANTIIERVHDHTISHHGSLLGGSARLNPRYPYALVDRTREGVVRDDDPLRTAHYRTTANDRLSINRGIHEWLTYDEEMPNADGYEGRSRLQIPTTLNANRHAEFSSGGGDSYLRFVNGHDTNGHYYAPTGAGDPTYSGSIQLSYNDDFTNNHFAGAYARPFQEEDGTWAVKMVQTNFAHVYTGESKDPSTSASVSPTQMMHNVKSPSGGMFMVSSIHIPSTVTVSTATRLLNYTGPLRFRGLGEMFHLRLSAHVFAGDFEKFRLKIGYDPTATYDESADDFDDTTTLATVEFDLGDLGLAGHHDAFLIPHGAAPYTALPYDETQAWADVFVYFDFLAGNWSAYVNDGTSPVTTGSITGSIDMGTAKGWSLDLFHSGYSTDLFFGADVLIDRAAVMLPMNWKVDGTLPPPLKDMQLLLAKDSMSTHSIVIMDDENDYALSALVTGSSATEWRMLAFAGNESRPIWSGVIETITHKQSSFGRTLETTIVAKDSLSILDRVLPLWDSGQTGTASISQHISMDYVFESRALSAQNLTDILNFGTRALTTGFSDIGYSSFNENADGDPYAHNDESRSHLYSGTAVQIYTNEDSYGPNNAEDWWHGRGGTSYSLSRIVGIQSDANKRSFFVEWDDDPHTFTGTDNEDSTITSYLGLFVGNTLTVEGTTGYDGNYTIDSFSAHRANDGSQFCEIIVDDVGAAYTDDMLFEVERIKGDDTRYGKDWLRLTTSAPHGMSVGDTFIMPRGCGVTTANRDFLKMKPLTVLEVPSSTTLRVAVEDGYDSRFFRGSETPFTAAPSYTGKAYDLTILGSHDAGRIPLVKPICYEGVISAETAYANTPMRVAHARWARDLTLSPWFKAQFGVISPEPLWRGGVDSHLNHPLSPQHISAHGLGGYSTNGFAYWDGIKTDLTPSSTSITFEEPGMAWAFKQSGEDYAIIELLDNETNDMQTVIASDIAYPSTSNSVSFDEATGEFTVSGTWPGLSVGDIVIHEGFEDARISGPMRIISVSNPDYQAERIERFEAALDEFAYMRTRYLTGSAWNYGAAHHFHDPDAIRVRVTDSSFALRGNFNNTGMTGTMYSGEVTATGVKGIRKNWSADKTIYSLRKVDESNGYKHLFVLWSDMRNDTSADADGGLRKGDFGLILPSTQNYSINVTFADQLNEQGLPDVFTELKIGEDVDVWSFDAQTEPYTEAAWSAQNGASNDEPTLFSDWSNWEDKAGSFVVVDASRFFNLNTAATNGRVGYQSGGLVDFGDYVLSVRGFPYLVDSYYRSAVTSWKNVTSGHKGTLFAQHPNARYMINDHTRLTEDITVGDTTIYVDDHTLFDTSGYGAIVAQIGDNRGAEDLVYYFAWTGKGTSATLGDYLSGVYITSIGNVADPATAEAAVESEVTAGGTGSRAEMTLLDEANGVTEGYAKVLVYNTTAALFALRLMLNIDGRVLSENGGTYYGSDKARSIFSLMTSSTWATTTSIPCLYDLSTIPQMKNMANTDSITPAIDDFGSMHDGAGQTILQIIQSVSSKDGNGQAGEQIGLSYLMGPDNLLSIRPTYYTGTSLNRNNVKISDMQTSLGSSITNVRVLYNGNSAHADYPEPTLGTTSPVRWRVLEHPDVVNREEALSIAKQSYLGEQQSRLSVTAEVLRSGTETNAMLSGARHGYVADAFRRNFYTGAGSDQVNPMWTSAWCGFPFSGVQDILDNNVDEFTEPAYTTTGLRAYMVPEAGGTNLVTIGFTPGTASVGTSASSLGANGSLQFSTSGGVITVEFDALNGGASYGTGVTVVSGWNTVADGSHSITFYATAGFLAQTINQAFDVEYSMGFTRIAHAHHYGTASLSNAVRIVHVDRNCPKTNDDGVELRLAVTIDSGTTAGNAAFRLWLLDYEFSSQPIVPSTCPTFAISSLLGSSSVQIGGSGFYRLAVPSSYSSAQESIVFSVDAEYLRAIVRKTSGDVKNAHNIPNGPGTFTSTYSAPFNTGSAFPLGVRVHSKDSIKPQAYYRAAWFAPRIHIVDDIAYRPATTLFYSDDYIDLTNEKMVVENVVWRQNAQDVESVRLTMQRKTNHYSYNLAGALLGSRISPPNDRARPTSPPSLGPSSRPRGPGGTGGAVTPSGLPFGGVGSGDQSFSGGGINANFLTNGVMRGINGRSSFSADNAVSSGEWGIIGQKKPSTALAADRDVDGIESSPAATEGAAIQTSDGISLAGITDPEAGPQGETNSYSTNIRVPSDVSNAATLTITGIITLEEVTGGGSAVITTTATCVETGASISQETTVAQGANRKSTVLMFSRTLEGASTPGNTIKVEVTRSPGQGSDSADYQTLVIHTLSVNLRRFSIAGNAQSNRMLPY